MPPKLLYALSVNVDDLRPWEFWQMDAEDYSMIRDLRGAWHSERDEERRAISRSGPEG